MNKYKYAELHGKIIAKFGTLTAYAKEMNLNANSVTNKLMGRTPWKQKEITETSKALNFNAEETALYFLL